MRRHAARRREKVARRGLVFMCTMYLALFVTDRRGWLETRNGIWLVTLVMCLSPLVVGGAWMALGSLRRRLASVETHHPERPADPSEIDRRRDRAASARGQAKPARSAP